MEALRAIDPHLSIVMKHKQQHLLRELDFEAALAELESLLDSDLAVYRERIPRLANVAEELWKTTHDRAARLQIIDAINAANAVIREADRNGVVCQLLHCYLVSPPRC